MEGEAAESFWRPRTPLRTVLWMRVKGGKATRRAVDGWPCSGAWAQPRAVMCLCDGHSDRRVGLGT